MNYVLVIDTAFETCQVGLACDGRLVAQDQAIAGGQHDRVLAGMTKKILDGANIAIKDISKIIVTTGPGRFTGLRVGIAFARGLALAYKTPLVGVLTTDALAVDLTRKHPDQNRAVIVCVKRGESFVQFLPDTDIKVVPDADLLVTLAEHGHPLLGGVIAPETAILLNQASIPVVKDVVTPDLATILALGSSSAPTDLVRPYYAASYAA